jgi:hypothetical protein
MSARLSAYRRDNSQGPTTPVFACRTGTELIRGLGHADPGLTLPTYVDLLDAGVGGGLEFPVQKKAAEKNHRPAG